MTKKKKRFLWLAIIAILILVAIAWIKGKSSDNYNVSTIEAEFRTIQETVIANGKIQPETEVIISSEVSGKILELPFKEGDRVKKGDLLVKINPDLAQSALDRAQAALNNARASKAGAEARLLQAEAQFKNNQTTLNRNQALYDKGAISKSEYDNVRAAFETAEAEVAAARENVKAASYSIQSAQAGVKEAADSYERTTIYSPMDGTISRLNVEVGEQVVGAMQMTGTEIMRVANLDVMEVLTDINESDIVRINFQNRATIEVDAYLSRKFKGEVTEIANSAKSLGQVTDQATNFEVKIRILQDSYTDLIRGEMPPFRPGMNASVEINTRTKENVLAVPIECVTTRTDTSSSSTRSSVERIMGEKNSGSKEPITCVFVLSGNKAVIRAVETGIQDDRYIEILSGLSEGEEVVSGPYNLVSQQLMPGDEVKVINKENMNRRKK